METTQNKPLNFFQRMDSPYKVMLGLYAVLLIAAFVLDTPGNIGPGIWRIVTSRSILVSDYAYLGGVGAMLVSAVIAGMFSLIILVAGGVKASGGVIMGLWLILGFGFFGKNIVNTAPIVFGVWLFARTKGMPFRDIAVTTMMCATVAPIVSEVAYITPFAQPAGAIFGLLAGMLIGFIFPPLVTAMGKVHGGFLLYNAGFVGGLIAAFSVNIMRNAGFEIASLALWSHEYTVPLAILMYLIAAGFIALGLIIGGREKWANMRKINKHTGQLLTDYYALYGDVAYLNVGILCALATTVTLALGGAINGATMGGIFCVAGFGVLGKNLRNVLPIMTGAILSAAWNVAPITAPGNMLAILFGTGIAPLAGKFGVFWGIVCGFIHVNLVSFIGLLNGGLNLYNNGFAGGFVVIFMMPIIAAVSRNKDFQ